MASGPSCPFPPLLPVSWAAQSKSAPAALEQRRAAVDEAARASSVAPADDDVERRDVCEQLRLLGLMRAGLPACGREPFVLVGPAGLVLALVGACLRQVVRRPHDGLGESDAGHAVVDERGRRPVAAWSATALDCRAVEGFCFDPGVDPVRAGAGPTPQVPVEALVRVGHEVARHALALGAQALAVEIPGVSGPLWFTYAQARVEVTAYRWELELSRLPEWERDRPPGL